MTRFQAEIRTYHLPDDERMLYVLPKSTNFLINNIAGLLVHWAIYYTSPQSFIINFSYTFIQQP